VHDPRTEQRRDAETGQAEHPHVDPEHARGHAAGDRLALEVWDITGHYLALGISTAVVVTCPEDVFLFGGPTKAGDLLMNPVRKAYDENVLFNYKGKAKLLLSELDGASAAVLGASALGWEL
jgi:glucokinase